jgi:hypothetical protein
MPSDQIPTKQYAHQLRKHDLPSIAWLRANFFYNAETGVVKNKRGPVGHKKRGYEAITISWEGYKVEIKTHRLAFALMQSRWPHLINHKDGNKTNNSWTNLEETTNAKNGQSFRNQIYKITERTTERKNGKLYKSWHVMGKSKTVTFNTYCAAWKFLQAMNAWREAERVGEAPTRRTEWKAAQGPQPAQQKMQCRQQQNAHASPQIELPLS